MKDTKDQILRSLNGLDRGQMYQVLNYINNLNYSVQHKKSDATFKKNALQQIREALNIKKDTTASV